MEGEWHGKQDWYGGKIEFRASLRENGDGALRIYLLEPELNYSSRFFFRVMGSRRFLRLKVDLSPEKLSPVARQNREKAIKEFFQQRFVLLGRIFVFMYYKEGTVFLYETDEDYAGRKPNLLQGDQYRWSLQSLLEWYMPPSKNGDQVIFSSYFQIAVLN
jgi:RNA-dependent RNA polymerase